MIADLFRYSLHPLEPGRMVSADPLNTITIRVCRDGTILMDSSGTSVPQKGTDIRLRLWSDLSDRDVLVFRRDNRVWLRRRGLVVQFMLETPRQNTVNLSNSGLPYKVWTDEYNTVGDGIAVATVS